MAVDKKRTFIVPLLALASLFGCVEAPQGASNQQGDNAMASQSTVTCRFVGKTGQRLSFSENELCRAVETQLADDGNVQAAAGRQVLVDATGPYALTIELADDPGAARANIDIQDATLSEMSAATLALHVARILSQR